MIKWEYRICKYSWPVHKDEEGPTYECEKALTAMGFEGWELVKLDFGTDGMFTVWKRMFR